MSDGRPVGETGLVEPERGKPFLTTMRKLALAATALLYVAGGAAVYAFIDEKTVRTAMSLPLALVAALLGLSLVNYAVRAWRWVVLAGHLGFRVPPASNALYYLAGFSLTSTPGKAGEAVRLWFLKFGHGVAYERSAPLMLADRLIDLWAVLLLALVSIAGFADYRWQGAALSAVVAAVTIPVLFARRFEPALGALYRFAPRRGRLLVRGRRMIRSMSALNSWRSYGYTLVPTVGGWLAEGAALYLVVRHFGADVTFLDAVFVFCFSIIVGAISMLPGGLGSTEAAIVILLRVLGVDLDTALAATAIVRVTTFWFAVAIGVALMPAAMNAAARSARIRTAQGPGFP